MTERVAYITGTTGQDGSYLAEHLLTLGYHVYGMIRRMSVMNTERIDHILGNKRFKLLYGDVTDSPSMALALSSICKSHPGAILEVYHLAAQSHVRISFDVPEYTTQADAVGTLKVLEECRRIHDSKIMNCVKVYIAETSELYGNNPNIPQNENTPFLPCSPYAISKLYSFFTAKMFREAYGMFVAIGILFNHESPRRTANFVTRKITIGLGEILKGKKDCIQLGNLDSSRDWGHAKDYVLAMHAMLQQPVPDEFVVASGVTRTVRQFIEHAFALKDLHISWHGSRGTVDEVGVDQNGVIRISIDPKYYRPIDVCHLCGDAQKANRVLGWKPSYSFEDLVAEMVESDC
jgi:GDPmannose 4,6-dehydratase